MSLAGLDSNQIVQFFANNDIGVDHLKDSVLFLFLVGTVNGVGKKGVVETLGTAFIRAFGSVNIALAIGLGTLNGRGFFSSLDQTMLLLVGAVFWSWYVHSSVPKEASTYYGYAQDLSWSIIQANNAAIGYAAGASAVGGSFWAPLFGAWVAVNGARLLENGFSAIGKKWDAQDLLAAVSGIFLWTATTHLQASAVTAQALLAAWSFSGNWIDWQAKWDKAVSSATPAK